MFCLVDFIMITINLHHRNSIVESSKPTKKKSLNPLRKLEGISQNESLNNIKIAIQGDQADVINVKQSPKRPESNHQIFKLVDDTIDFIDQELTKSYKQSNIGVCNFKSNSKFKINKVANYDNQNSIGIYIVLSF